MADSEAQGGGGIWWWQDDEEAVIVSPGVVAIVNSVGAVVLTESGAGCQISGTVGGVTLS